MNKKLELKFSLFDLSDLVKVELSDNNTIFNFEDEAPPPVRIRLPLPDKNKFIQSGLNWVEKLSVHPTLESWVQAYTRSRQKERYDEIQEIRKSLKRIHRLTECIKIAEDAYLNYKLCKSQK
jgi:hypothetical protein